MRLHFTQHFVGGLQSSRVETTHLAMFQNHTLMQIDLGYSSSFHCVVSLKVLAPDDGLVVFQAQQLCDLINYLYGIFQITACMAGRDTEPRARKYNGSGRKTHHNHSYISRQTFPGKCSDLPRVVDEHRDNGGVIVAISVQPNLLHLVTEPVSILSKLCDLLLSQACLAGRRDNSKSSDDLLGHNGRHCVVVKSAARGGTQGINDILVGRNIASHSTK
mmetsp:Transcript_2015/g.3839  ORF Transcript_2015/g.3839 Transcript_2015/m.3839 type:complete len:218 (-) Transcript_2015:1094-1747(-)